MIVNGYTIAPNADLRGADLRWANLRGANLRGADLRWANMRGSAIVIYGLAFPVYITKGSIQVGCQIHSLEEWKAFSNEQIEKMDPSARAFYDEHAEMLERLCESLGE